MQPTCRHVPPRNGSFSTTTVFSPSSPARIAATYPPGPLPIIATSYFATLNLPSVGGPSLSLAPPPRPLRARLGFRSRTSVLSPLTLEVTAPRCSYPCLSGRSPANFEFYQPRTFRANHACLNSPASLCPPGTLLFASRRRHRVQANVKRIYQPGNGPLLFAHQDIFPFLLF